jgi:hypothetical protein
MKRQAVLEDPPTQAVREAIQATESRRNLAALENFEAESLLSSVLVVLRAETVRMRRIALIVGGISLGVPVVLMLILLLLGTAWYTVEVVITSLSQYSVMGLVIAVLFGVQVTSRWMRALRVGVRMAPKLVDPAALPSLITLAYQARRRTDTTAWTTLEAALVRLLNRWDPEEQPLPGHERDRLLALSRRGGADLTVATLLALGSAGDEKVVALARDSLEASRSPERVRVAARECLETLAR